MGGFGQFAAVDRSVGADDSQVFGGDLRTGGGEQSEEKGVRGERPGLVFGVELSTDEEGMEFGIKFDGFD